MNPHKLSVLFLLAFSLATPLAVLAAHPVPFSESHPQYMAALAQALAQDVAKDAGNNPADLDEQFTPEDFGLTEVGFLPNNPLYLFKAARRGFSDVFTTNPQTKLENSLRFASEKLLEAAALSEQGARESSVASALDNFKSEINRARMRAVVASAELGDSEQGKEVGRSMMDAVIKYEKLIGKIEKGTSGTAVSAASEAKGQAAEALGTAFAFVTPAEAAGTLSKVLDSQRGSEFKDFKNLEVLSMIAEKAPESVQSAIQAAKETALSNLEDSLSASKSGTRAAFEDFVQNVGGNEVRHLEIIQDLEVRPLNEEARTILRAAKEEVLSRAETRLVDLSATEKSAFLSHLNDGNIGNLRAVNELEKNISTDALVGVSEIASAARQDFARKVEGSTANAGERAKLLESVEQFHDAQSLSVLDEIAALVPPEQRAVFASLKQKAVAEIQKDISRARNTAQERMLYQALSGDHPEEFQTLESLGGISDALIQGIRNATTEQIKARVGVIRDEARFGKYEEALRATGDKAGTTVSELTTAVAERRAVFGSRNKTERKISDVEAHIDELSNLVDSLPLNLGYGEEGFDESIRSAARLLNSAEARLASARSSLERGDFGVAYSEAQEAEFTARDGIQLARAYKSGKRTVFKEETERNKIESKTDQEKSTTTCQAYFEGYIFDEKADACKKQNLSACVNPFVYKTKNECEAGVRTDRTDVDPDRGKTRWVEHTWKFADGVETSMILTRTDSEYLAYIKNTETICRLMPKQQFLWHRGAGNDAADNWKNFGIPDCSGQAFSPANCGNNICELGETVASCAKDCRGGTSAGELYSCPGFAYERIDSQGKRYCQLNTKNSCNATYPQFLYESSYAPSLCPSELITGGTSTTATTTTGGVQFENCGANSSSYNCEVNNACDWYVPTRGSPYCAPAVRSSWISHTWRFSDGSTESSSILSRIDREYSEFITGVDAQCRTIPRNKFSWRPSAGNDAPDNWQNFGIPDCSGTATNTGTTGGGYNSTTCDSARAALLGTGCHSMGNAYFNSEMTKYVWLNGSTVFECSTGFVSGCSSSGGNWTATTTPYYPTSGGGGTSSMQKCFYPNAAKNGAPIGYTVWCEADYVNCKRGSQSGETISMSGVSLGAPSSCESGWLGGPSGSCNNNNYCDSWESAVSCPAECGSTGGGGTSSTGTPATPTGVTATANANTDGSGVTIRWTDASTNETYFKIWRQASGSWSFLTQVSSQSGNTSTTGTVTNHLDSSAPLGNVSYQIQACNTVGCSSDSTVATVWVSGGGTTTSTVCGDRICSASESYSSCPADCGGGGGSTVGGVATTCSSALTALLGTGCHQMYSDSSGNTIFCDGPMSKSAKNGDTVTTNGCTGPGGSGSTCTAGQYWNGSACVNTSTTDCPSGQYWSGGACVTSSTPSGGSGTACTGSQYWNGTTCVSSPSSACSSGQYWNGTGCVTSSPSCSSGQYWNGTSCVTSTTGASIWQAFGNWLNGE